MTYKNIYKKRIERFIGFLYRKNPQWITGRSLASWINDLETFTMKKDFFYHVLFNDDEVADEEKVDFYLSQIASAQSRYTENMHLTKTQDEYTECGFDIEQIIDDDEQIYHHRALLGYLWWTRIYKKIRKDITPEQRETLERKHREFQKQIKTYVY